MDDPLPVHEPRRKQRLLQQLFPGAADNIEGAQTPEGALRRPSWTSSLGYLRGIFGVSPGHLGAIFGVSSGYLGVSLQSLGSVAGYLGGIPGYLGSVLGYLGVSRGILGYCQQYFSAGAAYVFFDHIVNK